MSLVAMACWHAPVSQSHVCSSRCHQATSGRDIGQGLDLGRPFTHQAPLHVGQRQVHPATYLSTAWYGRTRKSLRPNRVFR